MSSIMRSELSEKNPYYLPKHRFLELKHFCMQYPEWKKMYNLCDFTQSAAVTGLPKTAGVSDRVGDEAIKKLYYADRMKLLEQSAMKADPDLVEYIIAAVTNGLSYPMLQRQMMIPCCRELYYAAYHKFFWYLSPARK